MDPPHPHTHTHGDVCPTCRSMQFFEVYQQKTPAVTRISSVKYLGAVVSFTQTETQTEETWAGEHTKKNK